MDEQTVVYQEVNVNREGIGVTAYVDDGVDVVVEDEVWWTWDELRLLMEEHDDVNK